MIRHAAAVPSLEDGSAEGEGRVMVYNDLVGSAGAVCSDDWGVPQSAVVCRQLGYEGVAPKGNPLRAATLLMCD